MTDFTRVNKSFHNVSLSPSFQMVYHLAPTGNGVVGYVNTLTGGPFDLVIKKGGRIGGNRHFLASRGLLLTKTSRGGSFGLWYDARDRYLGLKFKDRERDPLRMGAAERRGELQNYNCHPDWVCLRNHLRQGDHCRRDEGAR
jgi:hypothetical protein